MAFTQMKIDLGANMGTLRKTNIASWKSPSSSFLQWEIDRSILIYFHGGFSSDCHLGSPKGVAENLYSKHFGPRAGIV